MSQDDRFQKFNHETVRKDMGSRMSSSLIFPQKMDRAIFVAYFLGAIVPLIALGYVMDRYVFSSLQGDPNTLLAMLGLMSSVTILTLGSFFSLRRLTNRAVGQIDADNARLKGILTASRELSSALHVQAVSEVAVTCTSGLTSASAVLLLMRTNQNKSLDLLGSSGKQAQAIFSSNEELLLEFIEGCIESQSVARLGSGEVA